LRNYTSRELATWSVYYSKEPKGEQKIEYLLCQLLALTHNANSKKENYVKPQDFAYPNLWKSTNEKSTEAIIDNLSSFKGVKIHRKTS